MTKQRLHMQKSPAPSEPPPALIETPLTPDILRAQQRGLLEPAVRCYRLGELSVMLARSKERGWHITIAHPSRYPTGEELMFVRYQAGLPYPAQAVTMALVLPPQAIGPNSFHLFEVAPPPRPAERHGLLLPSSRR